MLTVIVVLVLLYGAFSIGRSTGRKAGVEEENLRVQHILHQAVQVVGHGGRIQVIWQRVEGNVSHEEMLDRLRSGREDRDAQRERLARYDAAYGAPPPEGETSGS